MLKKKTVSAILAIVIMTSLAILSSCTNAPSDTVSDISELDEASSGISSAEEEPSVDKPSDASDVVSDFSDIGEESSDDTSGEESIIEPVLQAEMTDEMWEIWFKEYGRDDEYNYSCKPIGILNDYLYLMISRLHKSGVSTALGSCYPADEYMFLGYWCGKSEIGSYLYADNKFITFEEGYESGLFKAAEAYALLEKVYGDEVGLVADIYPQYETSGEESIIEPVLQAEMTDEMLETFRKMCDYDPPEKDHEYF